MRSDAALLVVLALLAVAATPAAAQSTSPTDGVRIDVHVGADGDARWNVSTRFALETNNETAAFERLAAEFESGAGGVGFEVDTFEALVAAGANRTGREMALGGVERNATLLANESVGLVSLSFFWTNFAHTDGEEVVVGDAFDAWELGADQHLVVHPPPGYEVTYHRPEAVYEAGDVRWSGPKTFAAGQPALGYAPREPATTTTAGTSGGAGTTPPDGTVTTTGGPTGDGVDWGFGATVAAALLAGGLAAYALAQRESVFRSGGATAEAGGDGDGDEAATDEGGAAEESPEDGGDRAAPDPSLLSDEERVEALLEDNGGRMKQADIVSETGWSNAKVSQLLSGMAEEGRVEKLRIGRENLISLPGEGEEP